MSQWVFTIEDEEGSIPFFSDSKAITDFNPLNPSTDSSIWAQSPYLDGRQKINNRREYVIDSITADFHQANQNNTIEALNKLYEKLNKAIDYWKDEWSTHPVWIKAKGRHETNTRYAYITNWKLAEIPNPNDEPFGSIPSVADEMIIDIEHTPWQAVKPTTIPDSIEVADLQYLLGSGFYGLEEQDTDEYWMGDELPSANHWKPAEAQIDTVYLYDLSLGTYTLLPTAGGQVFPFPAAIGDMFLLGADEPFYNVVFHTAGGVVPAGWGYNVQIWKLGAFTTINSSWDRLRDFFNSAGTDANGYIFTLHAQPDASWTRQIVHGVNKYWMAITITAVGGFLPEVDMWPFTQQWPWLSIAADQFKGDLGSLLRQMSRNNFYHTTAAARNKMFIAMRSEDRCKDSDGGYDYEFVAHLNCFEEVLPPGATTGSAGSAASRVPWGGYKAIVMGGATALTQVWSWTWTDGKAWIGRYRVLARVNISVGTYSDLLMRLGFNFSTSGTTTYTDTISGNESGEQVLDLGVLDMAVFPGTSEYKPGELVIKLEVGSLAALEIQVYDITLIPADEVIIEITEDINNIYTVEGYYRLLVEGTMIPKTKVESWVFYWTGGAPFDPTIKVLLQSDILGELWVDRPRAMRLYTWMFEGSPNTRNTPAGYLDVYNNRFWKNDRFTSMRGRR